MDADASMCERRLPALSAVPQATDFDRQGYGLRWPDGNEREVRLHVPKPAPCAVTFDKCLPFSRLTGQMRRCLWRRGRRSCPPKPVDTRCLFLVMPGGGLSGVVTERRREEGRDAVARHGLT